MEGVMKTPVMQHLMRMRCEEGLRRPSAFTVEAELSARTDGFARMPEKPAKQDIQELIAVVSFLQNLPFTELLLALF